MKKYIFVTYGIINMGGGQMYLRNKMLHLQKEGYEVYIFSVYDGNIILNELRVFEQMIIPALRYPSIFFSKKAKNKVIDTILKKINYESIDDVYIESNDVHFSTWGEEIAQKVRGKHYIYIITETSEIVRGIFLDFIKFKFNRKEIAGVTDRTLVRLFGKNKELASNEKYNLFAQCVNVVEDYNHEINESIPHSDFTIASIGRLGKPYIIPMIEDLRRFALEFSDLSFNLLLIGGEYGDDSIENRISEIFSKINNVNVIITGYLFPIPLKLLQQCDVFVSSAGSSLVSHEEGFLTISIDCNDLKPIGILGYTTDNWVSRKNEPIIELRELLVDVLINKKYPVLTPFKKDNKITDFTDHLNFIKSSSKIVDYFNISKTKLPIKEALKYRIFRILGIENIIKIKTNFNKIMQ